MHTNDISALTGGPKYKFRINMSTKNDGFLRMIVMLMMMNILIRHSSLCEYKITSYKQMLPSKTGSLDFPNVYKDH